MALALSAMAQAATTLTISSWAPPKHGVNAIFWPALIAEMEKATEGRSRDQIWSCIPPAQYDLILDGAADMTWIFHGYAPVVLQQQR